MLTAQSFIMITAAATAVFFSVRRRAFSAKKRQLFNLWTNAAEVVTIGKEDKVVMVPVQSNAARAVPFPPLFVENFGFALTAYDPPGKKRTAAENQAKNEELKARLLTMIDPEPIAMYPSYGFDMETGWREDGFFLVYEYSVCNDHARESVLRIANEFSQGAIFEYAPLDEGSLLLRRWTVPTSGSGNRDEFQYVDLQRIPASTSH